MSQNCNALEANVRTHTLPDIRSTPPTWQMMSSHLGITWEWQCYFLNLMCQIAGCSIELGFTTVWAWPGDKPIQSVPAKPRPLFELSLLMINFVPNSWQLSSTQARVVLINKIESIHLFPAFSFSLPPLPHTMHLLITNSINSITYHTLEYTSILHPTPISSTPHLLLQDFWGCIPSGISTSSSVTTITSIPYVQAARAVFQKSKCVTLLSIQNFPLTPNWQQNSIISNATLQKPLIIWLTSTFQTSFYVTPSANIIFSKYAPHSYVCAFRHASLSA